MKKILSIFITALCIIPAYGSPDIPEIPRTGSPEGDTIPSYMRPLPLTTPDSSAMNLTPQQMAHIESLRHTLDMPSLFSPNTGYASTTPSRTYTAPGFVGFGLWNGAALHFSGSAASLPGLMGIESGSAGFTQRIGRLTIDAFASASHNGYFRGLQTVYGFGGSIGYRISDKLSLTLFGAYYTGADPLTPAMAGYMNSSAFGGYASFDFNDHWGVSVGAQTTRSTITNRWEAAPIVKPYYKFNRNVAVGVDVGGILYQIIQSYNSGYRHSNPTIGPPTGNGHPPVAPRR